MKLILKNNYINSLVSKFLLVFLGVLSSVLINRYLGPEGRGEYAYILNIVNIIVLFLNLGIYQSYPNYKRNHALNSKNTYFTIFIVQFILYSIISIVVALVLDADVYLLPALLIPTMILANQLRFISLIENINKRNLANVVNQIVYIFILLFIYFLLPSKYEYALIALLLKDILIIINFTYKYKYKLNLKELNKQVVFYSISFGFIPMLSSLLITMNYKLDIVILKHFVSFEQVGLYSVGVSLASQIWIIPDAFKDVIFSRVAKKDSIEAIVLSIKLNLYISLMIILGIIVFGKNIIGFLYGNDYLASYEIVVIIFIGMVPMIFFKLINPILIVKGKQKVSFYILLFSVVINLILNFILIPDYGTIGAAISSVFSYTVCGLVFIGYFIRKYHVGIKKIFIPSKQEIQKVMKSISG